VVGQERQNTSVSLPFSLCCGKFGRPSDVYRARELDQLPAGARVRGVAHASRIEWLQGLFSPMEPLSQSGDYIHFTGVRK